MSAQRPRRSTRTPLMEFARRVALANAITLLFIAVALFVRTNFDALLLVFAGLLLAMLLYKLADVLARTLPLYRSFALVLVVFGMVGVAAVSIWLGAGPVGRQVDELLKVLPVAVESARDWINDRPALRGLLPNLPPAEQVPARLRLLLPEAGPFFTGAFGALTNLVIVVFVGIYLAAQPRPYLRAMMALVPPRSRARAWHVLETLGNMLGRWLIGKAISMLIIGTVTSVSLYLLDIPLALVLGLIAGLLNFIPYIGPVIAGVPAVLIAFSQSPADGGYTLVVFTMIHVLEGYLLIPLIERRTIALPPALTIVMQVLLGSMAGLTGAALATPLTAVIVVLVAMLYVQDVLDVPVKPPGER